MRHRQFCEGNESKCINAVRVFKALKFNEIEDKVGYSRLITEHLAVKGYLEPCQKEDEFQFTEQGLCHFRTMRPIRWISNRPPHLIEPMGSEKCPE
jgi:hypothetical protein